MESLNEGEFPLKLILIISFNSPVANSKFVFAYEILTVGNAYNNTKLRSLGKSEVVKVMDRLNHKKFRKY